MGKSEGKIHVKRSTHRWDFNVKNRAENILHITFSYAIDLDYVNLENKSIVPLTIIVNYQISHKN